MKDLAGQSVVLRWTVVWNLCSRLLSSCSGPRDSERWRIDRKRARRVAVVTNRWVRSR